ncbi:hypothetical protein UlMin_041395 [Ulmus minor]
MTIFFFISLLLLPTLTSSQTCQRACGKLPLKYPFGSGSGCGDPRFQQYVTCTNNQLTFTTHTGSYPVTAIDYSNQVLYISDPTMSTCSCNQPSKGFGLDWEAPFSFHDDTVFALLDCSLSSSPIFRPNNGELNTDGNNSKIPLCDNQGAPICSFLYSCRAISTINLPISSCCVYTPVDLGPSFDFDLEKLECSSYSGFYSFNGHQSDPNSWKYGMALKYKFSVYNENPSYCVNCERSYGICGYNGANYNSFVCDCPSGLNTTNDCFFGANYSVGSKLLPLQTGAAWLMIYCLAWLLVWML